MSRQNSSSLSKLQRRPDRHCSLNVSILTSPFQSRRLWNVCLSSSLTPRLDLLVTGLDALKSHQAEFSQDLRNKVSTDIARAVSGAAGTEMSTIAGHDRARSTLQQAAGALSQGHGELATAVDNMVGKMQAAFGESSSQMNNEVGELSRDDHLPRCGQRRDRCTAARCRHKSGHGCHARGRRRHGVFRARGGGAGRAPLRRGRRSCGRRSALCRCGSEEPRGLREHDQAGTGASEGHWRGTGWLQRTLQAFQETHGAFRSTVAPLQQAITQLGGVQETLATQLEQTRSLSEALTGASHEAKQTLLSLQQAWASHEQRFASVDASAERFFGQIREGLDSYTSVIRTFVGELDEKFAKALHELGSVVNELETTVDGLEQTVRRQAGVR